MNSSFFNVKIHFYFKVSRLNCCSNLKPTLAVMQTLNVVDQLECAQPQHPPDIVREILVNCLSCVIMEKTEIKQNDDDDVYLTVLRENQINC